MISAKGIILLVGAIGLAACTQSQSQAPMAGTSPGPAAPPLQQQSAQQPGSAPTSAGTPTITGATGSGRPQVGYSGSGMGSVGGVPPQQQMPNRRP